MLSKKLKAYDHEIRLTVVERYERGDRQIDISRELNVSYSTVKSWINRYRSSGFTGLKLRYDQCGRTQKVEAQVKEQAIGLKRDHPTWGGSYIRMKLVKEDGHCYVPGARQLQRYFHQAGLVELTNKQPQKGSKYWARRALYRVQVDAKEQLRTADGGRCSYLTFTDEYSGAVLEALVFPPQVHPSSTL